MINITNQTTPINKTVFLFFILLLFLILFVSSGFSKYNNEPSIIFDESRIKQNCSIEYNSLTIPDSFVIFHADSLYIIPNLKYTLPFYRTFFVLNTTSDTFFLYSGLFNSSMYRQPQIHQYDSITKTYFFSLTPLYGYYREYFSSRDPVHSHYNWNRFVAICPGEYYQVRFYIGKDYLESDSNAIVSIDPHNSKMAYNPVFLSLKDQEICNSYIRLAIYSNIDGICVGPHIKDYESHYESQMNFRIISTELHFWNLQNIQ